MTERLILATVLQMGNTHPEVLANARENLREPQLAMRAEIEGVRIVGDDRWERIEYGSMVPTGELVEVDGELIPDVVWEPRTQEEAKYVRILWEARAER